MSMDTALVVIDAQVGVVGEAYHHDEVMENINLLLGRARSNGVPVIYVQHNEPVYMESGMPSWQIDPAVTPHEGEPVIQKESPDSFHETSLQEELAVRGIKHLVI
ncbi:MAG TPA: isochorismatase family protein, partial [Ktedonobacteraceae bacterium]|nr:isochorismatase family protein [Ktedonobacteraceae bacterium]